MHHPEFPSRLLRTLSAAFVVLLGSISFSCIEKPLEPVLPYTDLQMTVPLIDRTNNAGGFIAKDTLLSVGADGGINYSSSATLDSIPIGALTVSPEATSQQVELGTFTVSTPPPVTYAVQLETLLGSGPVDSTIVPASTFNVTGTDFAGYPEFEYLVFESGEAVLTVQNNLPVGVSFPNPVEVQNNRPGVDTTHVMVFGLPAIPQGGRDSSVVDLAGKTLQSALRLMAASISTPGSGGQWVPVNAQQELVFTLTFRNLVVASANAIIPQQSIFSVRDSIFTVDDSVSISSAQFRSGSFDIVLDNQIDVTVDVYFRFEEIKYRDTGLPFTINHTFNGRGTYTVSVNAPDLQVVSLQDTIGTYAKYSVGIETISSSAFRQIANTDYLRADVVPGDPIEVKSITGRIKPTFIEVRTGTQGLDFGDVNEKMQIENMSFDSIEIALKFDFTSGFPFDYNLRFVALSQKATPQRFDSIYLPPPPGSSIRRIYPVPGQPTTLVLDNSNGLNSFLSNFYPNFPDSFLVRGSVVINPSDVFPTPEGKQTIHDTSNIYESLDVKFPLKLAIAGAVLTDTVGLEGGETIPKDISQSVKSGTVNFEITNGFPVGMFFRAAMLKRQAGGNLDTLLWLPTSGPVTITAAPVDAGGSTSGTMVSTFKVTLDGPQMDLFNEGDVLWYQLLMETTGSGAQAVKLRVTDTVRIRASANVVYTVNKP